MSKRAIATVKKQKKLKPIYVDLFHIDSPSYINKTAEKIITDINKFKHAYRLNKHGRANINQVAISSVAWKKLCASINTSLVKQNKHPVTPKNLLYENVLLRPLVE